MQSNGQCKIAGIGAYLPDMKVTSEELMHDAKSKNFGVHPKFLERFSGIKERRFSNNNEAPSALAIEASKNAIKDASISPEDIDLILYCGIDRDYVEPATAHKVQVELGAKNADCLDITNACHGVMNGISIANAYISSGSAENILVCTGEKPSNVTFDAIKKLSGSKDRKLFRRLMGALTVGDAGGALLISKKDSNNESGCQWMAFQSKGEYEKYCYYRYNDDGLEFQMLMEEISNTAVDMHRQMIDSTYKKLDWTPESISHIYCHQAGAKPHFEMAKLARQPIKKAPQTYIKYGNLTSATIPVNMFLNPPKRGDKILIMGVGSGLSISQAGIIY